MRAKKQVMENGKGKGKEKAKAKGKKKMTERGIERGK